jgi:hypothetical protein
LRSDASHLSRVKKSNVFINPFKLFLEANLASNYLYTLGLACYQPHVGELSLFPPESNTNDVSVFHQLADTQFSLLPKLAILLVQIS